MNLFTVLTVKWFEQTLVEYGIVIYNSNLFKTSFRKSRGSIIINASNISLFVCMVLATGVMIYAVSTYMNIEGTVGSKES